MAKNMNPNNYNNPNQNNEDIFGRNQEKDGRTVSGTKSSLGGTGDPHKASPSAIARYIEGIHFPASKNDLTEQAKKNRAPSDVMEILGKFDDHEYSSVIDISKEVGRIEPGERHHEGPKNPSPASLEHYLRGISYPSSKQQLMEQARRNGAPDDILSLIEQFDDRGSYNSPIDVSKAFGNIAR